MIVTVTMVGGRLAIVRPHYIPCFATARRGRKKKLHRTVRGPSEVGDWHEVTPQRFSFRAGIVRKVRVPDRRHIRLDRGNECIRCRYRPPVTGQAWLTPFPDFDATHLLRPA